VWEVSFLQFQEERERRGKGGACEERERERRELTFKWLT